MDESKTRQKAMISYAKNRKKKKRKEKGERLKDAAVSSIYQTAAQE